MFGKSLGVCLFAVATVCAAVSSSLARDGRKAEISVSVYSVKADNLSESIIAPLVQLPGVVNTSVTHDKNVGGPVTAIVMKRTANAEKQAEHLLSKFSDAGAASSGAVVALGKKMPFEVVTTIPYVSKVTTTQDIKGVVHLARQISEVKPGFVMSLTPKMKQGKLGLDYVMTFSRLNGPDNGFKNVSIGGTTVQLVRKSARSIAQSVKLPGKSGTFVVMVPDFEKNRYVVALISASKL